jgi:hypothetical protein
MIAAKTGTTVALILAGTASKSAGVSQRRSVALGGCGVERSQPSAADAAARAAKMRHQSLAVGGRRGLETPPAASPRTRNASRYMEPTRSSSVYQSSLGSTGKVAHQQGQSSIRE